MGKGGTLLFLLVAVGLGLFTWRSLNSEDTTASGDEGNFAILTSCSGCRLKRLPEIKFFIKQVAPEIPNLMIEYGKGDPRIRIYPTKAAQLAAVLPTDEDYKDMRDLRLAQSNKEKTLPPAIDISSMSSRELVIFLLEEGVIPYTEEDGTESGEMGGAASGTEEAASAKGVTTPGGGPIPADESSAKKKEPKKIVPLKQDELRKEEDPNEKVVQAGDASAEAAKKEDVKKKPVARETVQEETKDSETTESTKKEEL